GSGWPVRGESPRRPARAHRRPWPLGGAAHLGGQHRRHRGPRGLNPSGEFDCRGPIRWKIPGGDDVIAIIGAGKMGEALLAGLVARAEDPKGILVTEPRPEQAERIRSTYAVETAPVDAAVKRAETVILALKPQDM